MYRKACERGLKLAFEDIVDIRRIIRMGMGLPFLHPDRVPAGFDVRRASFRNF